MTKDNWTAAIILNTIVSLPSCRKNNFPHFERDDVVEYFKSYHGLYKTHDLVHIGSLHFFMCLYVLVGLEEELRELGKKVKGTQSMMS